MNPDTKNPPTITHRHLSPAETQLDFIINMCSQNSEISNRQIRSILSMLASNLQEMISRENEKESDEKAMIGIGTGRDARREIEELRAVLEKKTEMLDAKIEKVMEIGEAKQDHNTKQLEKIIELEIVEQYRRIREEIQHLQKKLLKEITKRQANVLETAKKDNYQVKNIIKQVDQQLNRFIRETEQKIKKELVNERMENCERKLESLMLAKSSGELAEKIKKAVEPEKQKTMVKKQAQDMIKASPLMRQIKIEKMEKVEKVQNKEIISYEWVDQKCLDFPKISCMLNSIKCNKQASIFSKVSIKQKNSFSIRIQACQTWLTLGVASSYQKKNPNMPALPQVIYYQNDASCWDQGTWRYSQGHGFKQGETVTVWVDTEGGFIVWKVGEIVKHRIRNTNLRDGEFGWVPYVGLSAGSVVNVL